jgi:hypothetical protein
LARIVSQHVGASGRRAQLLLLLGVLVAYAVALVGPFQFDDRGVILRDPTVQSLSATLTSLWGLRPLLKLSYSVCWALGQSPVTFHVFNLLVHLLNVALLVRVFAAATDPELRWPFRARMTPGATVAAVLFALHPIQTEAVTYISGRSASLGTTFLLLALLLYAEGVRAGSIRYWLGFTSLAFLAALATKETSATLPLGLLLWDLLLERSRPRAVLRRFGPWLAVGLTASVLLIMNPRYFTLLYNVLGQRSLADSLTYQLGGLAYLFGRLSLLEPLCIDPGLWSKVPSGAAVTGAVLVVVAVLGLAGWRARREPLLLFGVGWFLLQVFVPFVLLPRVDVINERHAYVGNAGLFLALGALADRALSAPGARLWRSWLPGVLGFVLAALTLRRNLDYRSEVQLWQSTVRVAPKNPRAQNNLGVAYELEGRNSEAFVAYMRALKLEPRYVAAQDNLVRLDRKRSAR